MTSRVSAARMRAAESFRHTEIPDVWTVIRVDGRGFSKLTEQHFRKPADGRMHLAMLEVLTALMKDFGGRYGYAQSDEVSILLPDTYRAFNRSHEKIVSVAAGLASATFSSRLSLPGHFDARVWLGREIEDVVDYFAWRRDDGDRNAVNDAAYWTLRNKGFTPQLATSRLKKAGTARKLEMLAAEGVEWAELPAWQREGVAAWWELVPHDGMNPITGRSVQVSRWRLRVAEPVGRGDLYRAMVRGIVTRGVAA